MRNPGLNLYAVALILLGILIPLAVFFGSLWQNHPDPSRVQFEDLPELKLLLAEGRMVFECRETGRLLPLEEAPLELLEFEHEDISQAGTMHEARDILMNDETALQKFMEEYSEFRSKEALHRGRVEVGLFPAVISGGLLIFAGAFATKLRRRPR